MPVESGITPAPMVQLDPTARGRPLAFVTVAVQTAFARRTAAGFAGTAGATGGTVA